MTLFTISEPDLRRELYARLSVREPMLRGLRHYICACRRCRETVLIVPQPEPGAEIDAVNVLSALEHVRACGARA